MQNTSRTAELNYIIIEFTEHRVVQKSDTLVLILR